MMRNIRWMLMVSVCLPGCGLSNVGPEVAKLAAWRASGDAAADASPDAAVADGQAGVDDGSVTDVGDGKSGGDTADANIADGATETPDTALNCAALDCDDGNICTTDSCATTAGCDHGNAPGGCDDGDACTTTACAAGVCTVTKQVDCDDSDVCTTDSCAPAFGCSHGNNLAPCDDGVACTVIDHCTSGMCAGKPALFTGSWSGLEDTMVATMLPRQDGGFVGLGYETSPSAPSVGRGWTFNVGDDKPLAWPIGTEKISAFDTVQLPNGVTVAVGVQFGTDAWLGAIARVDDAKTKLGPVAVEKTAGGLFLWWRAAAIDQDTFAAVGREPSLSLSSSSAHIGFYDVKSQAQSATLAGISKLGDVVLPGIDLTGIVADAAPSATTGVFACGTKENGRPWFVHAKRSAVVGGEAILIRSLPFGQLGGTCHALAATYDGELMAVGSAPSAPGTPERARWWRLRRNGSVAVTWTHPSDTPSAFVDVTATPDGTLFAIGSVGQYGKGVAGLFARIQRDGVQTWPRMLAGKTDRDLMSINWHPAGYLVATGSQLEKNGADATAPLVLALDVWGHSSCASAGACAKVALNQCSSTDSCTTADCTAAKGCVLNPRSGACDDGVPCTVAAVCKAGSCQAGVPRLGESTTPLHLLSNNGSAVYVAAVPGGDAVVAFQNWDAKAAAQVLAVERRQPSGATVWARALLISGAAAGALKFAEPTFLVHNGGRTWLGGGRGDGNLRWLMGLDGQGKTVVTKTDAGAQRRWLDAAPAPASGLLTIGRSGDGFVARRWTATGATLWEKTLKTITASSLGALQAVRASGAGWLIVASDGGAAAPGVLGLNADGSIATMMGMPPGVASAANYLGGWETAALLTTPSGAALIDRWPVAAGAQAPTSALSGPRIILLTPKGAPRHSLAFKAIAPQAPPSRLLAAAAGADGGLWLWTAVDTKTQTTVRATKTDGGGMASAAWSLPLPNAVDLMAAVTVTSDGAWLLVRRTRNTKTNKITLALRRMTPWGQSTCAAAGECADERAESCASGLSCAPGWCSPATGCGVAPATACLPADLCTGVGACVATVCSLGKSKTDCNDMDPCTADSCDAQLGCVHKPVAGGGC